MAEPSLYPPNPRGVASTLGAPSIRYRLHAGLTVIALVVFFAVYLGLLGFCLLFILWAIVLGSLDTSLWFPVKVLAILATPFAAFVFAVLLKSVLRTHPSPSDDLIEILPDQQPVLFAFIFRVCEDLGVPPPAHVYVNHRANAYLRRETSTFFHRLLQGENSLVIGLGAVNAVTLTEFKALLAHEFGHAAQASAQLDWLAIQALRICHNVVDRDDVFKRFVRKWSRLHPIIAFPAYILGAALFSMRMITSAIRCVLVASHHNLRHQLEFNADLVAVRLTGSDAIGRALHRCSVGQASMVQLLDDLALARESNLYTRDLFCHQAIALNDSASEKLAPDHPSLKEREQNARAHSIPTLNDERAAWILFNNATALREHVTREFYYASSKAPSNVAFADPAAVQRFIDDETADRRLGNHRLLRLNDIGSLVREIAQSPRSIAELAEAHATLCNAEQLAEDEDLDEQAAHDRLVFAVHFQMAGAIDPDIAKELWQRHEYHLKIQTLWQELQQHVDSVRAAVAYLNLQAPAEVGPEPSDDLPDVFRTVDKTMRSALTKAETLTLPSGKNLPAGLPLCEFLLTQIPRGCGSENELPNTDRRIMRMISQFNEVRVKLSRIRSKCLAGIRAFQEKIGVDFVQGFDQEIGNDSFTSHSAASLRDDLS